MGLQRLSKGSAAGVSRGRAPCRTIGLRLDGPSDNVLHLPVRGVVPALQPADPSKIRVQCGAVPASAAGRRGVSPLPVRVGELAVDDPVSHASCV